MSTINNILTSLNKLSRDKKELLLNRYSENSQWLNNELDLVIKLIQQNPREKSTLITLSQCNDSSSNTSNQSKKRKSPETAIAKDDLLNNNTIIEKESPDQKRQSKEDNSSECDDIETLIIKAGLTSDLNKLKKEQLLEEIEKRSQYTNGAIASMKSLKKDLIDILKEALLVEHRQNTSFSASQESNTSATSSSSNNTSGPVRKGSLMAEFRTLVHNRESLTTTENPDSTEWKTRIESEFQARQNRHRDSQSAIASSRKSSTTVPMSSSETLIRSEEIMKQEDEVEVESVVNSENQEPVDDKIQTKSTTVSSPSPSPSPAAVVVKTPPVVLKQPSSPLPQQTLQTNEKEEEEVMVTKKQEEVELEEGEECLDNSDNCSVSPISDSSSSPRSTSTDNKTVLPIIQQQQEQQGEEEEEEEEEEMITTAPLPLPPKTYENGNIVSFLPPKEVVKKNNGTSSFLDKTQAPKAIVPALEKAKQLKAQEEIRLQNKKKEQEQRLAAIAQSKANATSSPHTKPSTKPVPAKPVANNNTAGNNNTNNNTKKPVAGGLFSSLFGKKTIPPPTATTTSTSIDSQPQQQPQQPQPVASLSSKPSFDISVVSLDEGKTVSPPNNNNNTNTSVGNSISSEKIVSSTTTTTVSSSSNNNNNNNNSSSSNNNTSSSDLKPSTTTTSSVVPVTPSSSSSSSVSVSKTSVQSIVAAYNNAIHISVPVSSSVVSPPPAIPIKPVSTTTTASTVPPKNVLQEKKQSPLRVDETTAESEYKIVDRDDSDDSGSGTDDDEESVTYSYLFYFTDKQKEKKKKADESIPQWARGANLKEALERQYGMHGCTPMDPDLIFHEVQSCNLEEIFGCKEGLTRKYNNRTSSAHWDPDQITLVEKRAYRKHMGYDKTAVNA